MTVQNKKLADDVFLGQRKEVLSMWHTGKEVNLDEAIEYNKKLLSLPAERNNARKMKYAKEHNEIYASTGMGKATVDEQIELLQYVETEGSGEVLGISPDSMTRYNRFEEVQKYM